MPDRPSVATLHDVSRSQIPESTLNGRGQLLADKLKAWSGQFSDNDHAEQGEIAFGLGLFHWYTARPVLAAAYFHSAAEHFQKAEETGATRLHRVRNLIATYMPLAGAAARAISAVAVVFENAAASVPGGGDTLPDPEAPRSGGSMPRRVRSVADEVAAAASKVARSVEPVPPGPGITSDSKESLRAGANEAVARRRAGQTSTQIQRQLAPAPSDIPPDPDTGYLRGLREYGIGNLANAETTWRDLLTPPPAIIIERALGGPDLSERPMDPEEARLAAALSLVSLYVEQGKTPEAREVWDSSVDPKVGAEL